MSKQNADDQKAAISFDRDRLEQTVQDVLFDAALTRMSMERDPEIILEVIEYFLDEIQAADLSLDQDELTREEIKEGGSLSLTSVEAHPLCGVLQKVTHEMLGVSTADAIMLASDILDAYYTPEQDAAKRKEKRQKRGVLGECEMCERCMMLTEHHLIPRSTHSTLLQRAVFPRSEMTSRLAMLCRPCHSFIHHHISVMDLALTYNTVDALLAREDVFNWARYASKLKERDPSFGLNRELKNKR